MIEQAFEVATEFRFDVGQAIINTDALKGAVDDLSKSAGSALGSLNYLASGLIAHLGFGSGGLLSLMSKAVQISEAFNASSLNFANNISSNMSTLTGTIDTFNNRLGTSQMLMNNIAHEAIKFGLDTTQLSHMTQLLATPLANRGKLGTNYEGAISMGRNLSLASEAVGINPTMAGEQLSRAITDHMAIHGALFARLVNTQAFKQAGIGTQPKLMTMNTDKKIDLLNKALGQLAGDAEFIASRISRLGVQMTILKDQIELVLRPIGEAIEKPLKMMLQSVNVFLAQNGEAIGKNIAAFISDIFQDPQQLFVNLLQLKSLGKDFKSASHVVEIYGTLKFLRFALELIGVKFNGGLFRAVIGMVVDGFKYLAAIIPWGGILRGAFNLLRAAFMEIAPVFAAAMILFQGISRAKAIAKAEDIKEIAALTPRLTAVMVRWKHVITNFMSPIQQIIEELANLLAPIFKTSNYLLIFVNASEELLPMLEECSNAFLALAGDVHGFSKMISAELGYVFNLPNELLKSLTSDNPLKNLKDTIFNTSASDAFTQGKKDFLDQNMNRLGKPGDSAANYQVVNNNHIEARFDMREQMEPDRIAFAVTTHLKKLAINPSQGRGESVHTAFANPKFAGGT